MSHASLVEALDLYYFQKGLSAELSKTAGSLGNEASKCTSPSGVRQQRTPPYYALLLTSTANEGADGEGDARRAAALESVALGITGVRIVGQCRLQGFGRLWRRGVNLAVIISTRRVWRKPPFTTFSAATEQLHCCHQRA